MIARDDRLKDEHRNRCSVHASPSLPLGDPVLRAVDGDAVKQLPGQGEIGVFVLDVEDGVLNDGGEVLVEAAPGCR